MYSGSAKIRFGNGASYKTVPSTVVEGVFTDHLTVRVNTYRVRICARVSKRYIASASDCKSAYTSGGRVPAYDDGVIADAKRGRFGCSWEADIVQPSTLICESPIWGCCIAYYVAHIIDGTGEAVDVFTR